MRRSQRFNCWAIFEGDDGKEVASGRITLFDVTPTAAAAQYARERDRLMTESRRVHIVCVDGHRYWIRRSHEWNGIEYIVADLEVGELALTK